MRRPYLVSRELDFWLVGGASILVWALLGVASHFREWYGIRNQVGNLTVTMASLSLLVNYPHFLASYRLTYTRGRPFILRHWFQTLLVPLLLVAALTYAFCVTLQPAGKGQAAAWLGQLTNLMFFTVGWHYSKQAFGCIMAYAHYLDYPFTVAQREAVRWGLFSIWWYQFADPAAPWRSSYWELSYPTWRLPLWLGWLSLLLFVSLQSWVLVTVIVRNLRQGHAPPVHVWTPYVALLLWFAPCFRQSEFFFYLVPFFHSLQYLAFVYRVESNRPAPTRVSGLVLGLIGAGWLCFEFLPGNLDMCLASKEWLGFSFCLLAAHLFLNLHHYFLDNVLWRLRQDPEVRLALLG